MQHLIKLLVFFGLAISITTSSTAQAQFIHIEVAFEIFNNSGNTGCILLEGFPHGDPNYYGALVCNGNVVQIAYANSPGLTIAPVSVCANNTSSASAFRYFSDAAGLSEVARRISCPGPNFEEFLQLGNTFYRLDRFYL